jgi:uncharacterized tellurite resistance protein B-like protein
MLERFLRSDDDDGEVIDRPAAVCALLVAAARADGEFAADEARAVAQLVAAYFSLSPEDTAALVTVAAGDDRLDLYPVTSWLVDHTDRAQRREVVGLMWRVVLSDGRLAGHEDVLVHRVGKALQLPHREIIAEKLVAGRGD